MSKKLLIIDDSQDLLDALKMFLEKKNYTVESTSTTEKIVPLIRSYRPDLIILDVFYMATMGGKFVKNCVSTTTQNICAL